MSTKVFTIDYKRLVVLLLPTFLRKPILFSLIKALVRPIIILYDDFLTIRTSNLYKANTNGQVCRLSGMLNDNFDSDERRIYISDGTTDDWAYVYKESTFNTTGKALIVETADETTTDNLGDTIMSFNNDNDGVHLISKQGSVGSTGLDFMVMVPTALRGVVDENKMTALVNYYKLASKRYAITYY